MVKHKSDKELMYDMIHMGWVVDKKFKTPYLPPKAVNEAMKNLRELRYRGLLKTKDLKIIVNLIRFGHSQYYKFKRYEKNIPRIDAQLFINKKNVRQFIFKRDNYKCLCCGSKKNLSIDHIKSVYFGGKNKLGNLQTLCMKCNSRKGIEFIDYRTGGYNG